MKANSTILDKRGRELLTLIIQAHLCSGEPVGSRTISKTSSEGLSSATIRNVMADLEEAGFLEQPHTSAGRVPTDQGYRFYLDHLLEQTRLSPDDEDTIQRELLSDSLPSADQIMSRASHLLSQLSQSVGIVVSPNISRDVIRHIEFVRISDGRILVITVSRAGLVQDRLVRVAEDFNQDELDKTARYLNANFSGKTLSAIHAELVRRLMEEKALYDRLLQNAILLCHRGLSRDEESEPEVFVEGASNILSRREFTDLERIRELLQLFEEKRRLVSLLSECVSMDEQSSSVTVRLGSENTLPGLQRCAVVTACYRYGNQMTGNLGVVGPLRMEYARTINVVSYVASMLERVLNDAPATVMS
ncbi:MAG TPA: heat-inducible transcriptional repressor HrcA [Blastocatellia bacterium]|nr:heat-inducible transcriptional repressor HrcA [Blastocatellia bacterium]